MGFLRLSRSDSHRLESNHPELGLMKMFGCITLAGLSFFALPRSVYGDSPYSSAVPCAFYICFDEYPAQQLGFDC